MMKLNLLLLFPLILSVARADWIPPEHPDPHKILNEARTDAAARRYEDALAKHLWFHQSALKYDSALYGVRLSFALSDWVRLGAMYPPALHKLKAIRDEASRNVRDDKAVRESFHDFASINKKLEEEDQTRSLFTWLDSNKPKIAKSVYELAQPSLIKAKEYRLCGKYLDPETSFQGILNVYRQRTRMRENPELDQRVLEHAEKSFSNSTATLVALLVLNERKADADRVATEAFKAWDDPQFKQQLDKARNGEVPPPWP